MKKNDESAKIAYFISDFLNTYAPTFLTNSRHTLKSYKDSLVLYLSFLETENIKPDCFSRECFERAWLEKWILWLKKPASAARTPAMYGWGHCGYSLNIWERKISNTYIFIRKRKKSNGKNAPKRKYVGLHGMLLRQCSPRRISQQGQGNGTLYF